MSDIENNYFDIYQTLYESEDSDDDIHELKIPKNTTLSYPLNNIWNLYSHSKSNNITYESGTNKICDIDNLIKFWQVFNNYPKPSELFNTQINMRPILNKQEITSLSFFKNGIKPEWEDPLNINGADISKRSFNRTNIIEEVDEDWMNLLMYVICGSYDFGITGIRVVDNSTYKEVERGRKEFKFLYRIEMWFDDYNKRKIAESYFIEILNISDPSKIHYKNHKQNE